MATSRVPARELRRVCKLDVVTYTRDKETGEQLQHTSTVMKACPETRVCVRCERTDLLCNCA